MRIINHLISGPPLIVLVIFSKIMARGQSQSQRQSAVRCGRATKMRSCSRHGWTLAAKLATSHELSLFFLCLLAISPKLWWLLWVLYPSFGQICIQVGVSKNGGTLRGFSTINHSFLGSPIHGNHQMKYEIRSDRVVGIGGSKSGKGSIEHQVCEFE